MVKLDTQPNNTYVYDKVLQVYKILVVRFSSGVSIFELNSIAIILSNLLGIQPPSREMKRNFERLLTWYADNWEVIYPVLPNINLMDENYHTINLEREQSEHKRHRPRHRSLYFDITQYK